MKRYFILIIVLVCTVPTLLTGCGRAFDPLDFLVIYRVEDGAQVSLGNDREEISEVWDRNNQWHMVWFRYDEDWICIRVRIESMNATTVAGIPINSHYSEVIPAYLEWYPYITIELDTPEKIILSKVIDGVRYTHTYRNRPDSGYIRTITVTNTDRYTENEDDYR